MPLVSSRIYKDVLQYFIEALPGLSAKRKQIYSREKRETNGIVLASAVSTTHGEKGTVSSSERVYIYRNGVYKGAYRIHIPCVHNSGRVSEIQLSRTGESIACRYSILEMCQREPMARMFKR